MAFVPLNTNNSNLANYNSVNSLMLDYQGFKKAVNTSSSEGWVSGVLPSVSSVSYNGNRSYDITFAGDVSTYLSPGMRLKTVRQVTAPTQCTSLNGTTQYYSKTSPTGLTFTTTFTVIAWIKMTSYTIGGIINRRNADTEGWSLAIDANGRVSLIGQRIAANNKILLSNQSIPLNKWVHVAATIDMTVGDTSAQKIWIDGVEVPRTYTLNGTATALVQGTTALVVGARWSDGNSPFQGKIAQAAVFSSQLSDATVKSYYSQGLSGTETNLVSAYSFNNTINDLNTTNANNLTAQGSATATNADSPFSVNGSGTATGTDDYAIVQAVSSTIATVSLPAGCTIPTSGGVAATYISAQKNPFNWIIDKDRWEILARNRTLAGQGSPVNGTYYNLGSIYLNVPKGIWDLRYDNNPYGNHSTSGTIKVLTTLSTLTNNESDRRYTVDVEYATVVASSGTVSLTNTVNLSSATTYYILTVAQVGSLATIYNLGDRAEVAIKALPSGL